MVTELLCPSCGVDLAHPLPPRPPSSTSFETCIRRCEPCGVGLSNAATNPTTIWEDPLRNIPEEVREGAESVVRNSLNERSRPSKWKRFGFSTSEDALTWTVFSWMAGLPPEAQVDIFEALLGVRADSAPRVLLWGTDITNGGGEDVRDALVGAANKLDEQKRSRSEPDVVLDFGPAGVVFIEVKYRSGNDRLAGNSEKWDRYLGDTDAFADPDAVRESGLYELARNWRFASELRDGRPMTLVNLGRSDLFRPRESARLDRLESGLSVSDDARLLRLDWGSFLNVCSGVVPFPAWLSDYLGRRELLL